MENLFETHEKERIGEMLLDRYKVSGFSSQAKFAKSAGFDPADLTNLKGKKWMDNPQLLGQAKWIRLARYVGFTRDEAMEWRSADTYIKGFIFKQLETYQKYQFSGIFCDEAGIGKTHTCKEYAKSTPNAFYMDCSKSRTRNRFIKAICRTLGLDIIGQYDDLLENAIYALGLIHKPIIILDEAGDLDDRAFLELKRIINDLEGNCAFYMIAADGLKAKIERGIACKKVGFTEVFSRFGKKFSNITDKKKVEQKYPEFLKELAYSIIQAQGEKDKVVIKKVIDEVVASGSLKDMRVVYRQLVIQREKKQLSHVN